MVIVVLTVRKMVILLKDTIHCMLAQQQQQMHRSIREVVNYRLIALHQPLVGFSEQDVSFRVRRMLSRIFPSMPMLLIV
jgi:hypothetical protein